MTVDWFQVGCELLAPGTRARYTGNGVYAHYFPSGGAYNAQRGVSPHYEAGTEVEIVGLPASHLRKVRLPDGYMASVPERDLEAVHDDD